MEIFVFPELIYSLVLANIMSPRVWAWRDHEWFARIDRLTPYRRIMRLKQFIIDHYEFNLDLDTWGLTTQEKELARFRPWMDPDVIARSNALFGYEGDQHYFDLDIRRHFGLDQYDRNVIPYWKTETVEAMDGFRHKSGYSMGAGECVSLSTLYAAALFIVCGISLEKIFLMATPLHSQNFVDVGDGVLTNNRRVVTKNMWFNGTELTAKAQRALRHEQVTLVAHQSGCLHVVYPQATIAPEAYRHFRKRLQAFLSTDLDMEILANYLRQNTALQRCFQVMHVMGGKPRYIGAEQVYGYEQSSSFKVSDATRERLLEEIDEDEYFPEPLEGRIPLNKFEEFFRQNRVDLARPADVQKLMQEFNCYNQKASEVIRDLAAFIRLEPHLPDTDQAKTFVNQAPIELDTAMSRAEVIARLEGLRRTHPTADLAFYAYRDWSRTDPRPFVKAALERNPVAIQGVARLDDAALVDSLAQIPNESLYDGARMAQPDEVWNFGRGDGLERALCLAGIWRARHPDVALELDCRDGRVTVRAGALAVDWPTAKPLRARITLADGAYHVTDAGPA